MATLIVSRTSEYNNYFRKFELFVDGTKIGTIGNGQKKEFAIAPGLHSLTAKIDWCSSPDLIVMIAEEETKEVSVGGFKNGKWIMGLAGAVILLNLFFKYVFLLIIPVFILLFYFVTFGRKKYLTLKEVS